MSKENKKIVTDILNEVFRSSKEQSFESHIPAIEHDMKINARITRIKYDALIEEGFSEEQALELCKVYN